MKLRKSFIPISLAAMLLAGVLPARAEEETGRIIEKLVAEVDKKLSTLEELSDKQNDDKQAWRGQLEEQYKLYDKATNVTDRAAIRGEIVGLLARLNKADRAEVKATVDTVVSICETMKKLQTTVQNSSALNPEKAKEQKMQVSRVIQNTAKILKTVEKIDEGKPNSFRTAALKNSLAMLHRQIGDPLTGTGSALARIAETQKALEDVAVQLHILQGMLDNEQTMLLTATHVQTVDLALMRLGRARLGADSVADIPVSRNNDIVERVRKSWGPISESDATLTGSSISASEEDFQLLGEGVDELP
jgi:vacuolar-type H+-ATPase subunit I/STV1